MLIAAPSVDAVNLPGLLIDNIASPESGYTDDAETDAGGWESVGWARTDNSLAQRWLVQPWARLCQALVRLPGRLLEPWQVPCWAWALTGLRYTPRSC